jgi:hypothetical protein
VLPTARELKVEQNKKAIQLQIDIKGIVIKNNPLYLCKNLETDFRFSRSNIL